MTEILESPCSTTCVVLWRRSTTVSCFGADPQPVSCFGADPQPCVVLLRKSTTLCRTSAQNPQLCRSLVANPQQASYFGPNPQPCLVLLRKSTDFGLPQPRTSNPYFCRQRST